MADDKHGWKQFDRLNFDSKNFSKRMKKAEGATTRHAHKFIVKRLDNIRSARRQIVGWLLLVGIMIAAVGVQLLWFQRGYQTTAAAAGGTYAEASLGPIETLNPLYASSDAEVAASRLLFSSLYTYDKTGHLNGDLADGMQVDDTGRIYTVSLRPGAKWHDGTQLTAKDVSFTVNLIKNPETRSPLRVNWEDVKVEAINDTTVKFTLPAVYAAFPYALTFSILPEHILGTVAPGAVRENTFSRSPMGSGPFSFRLLQTAEASQDHKVVHMNAFEKYYRGTPKLNRFEVHAYGTEEGIIRALRTGEVSAAANISSLEKGEIDPHNYNVTSQPVNSGVYALFNANNPILASAEVRRALQLASDPSAIRKDLAGNPPSLELPFINGQLTGDGVLKVPAHDTTAASALLDKAGWVLVGNQRQKGDQKLTLTITTTKDDQYEKVLELLAAQWRKIGVDVKTNVIDTSNPSTNFIQNTLQPRNYDILVYELLIGADPDVYAYWHSSQIGLRGYNFANYTDSTADAALASARSRLEPELRNAKYKTFAQKWVEDVPAVGLYQSVSQYAANTNVTSVDSSAKLVSPADRFENVLYWSVRKEAVYKTP
ncbi:MAG TPA: peptide ABC transporter substrate-binding protein [Candidatus Saccharimonadales bacterium]